MTIHRPSSLRLQAAFIFFLVLSVIWGFTVYLTQRAEESALRNAEERSQLLARTFAEHTRATVRLVDLAATQLADAWSRGPRAFEAQVERTRQNLSDIALQIGAADSEGMVSYSDLARPTKPVSLRDREHIRVHLDSDQERLFISKPVKGRVSNKWSIQFTRPIRRAGRNVGVMVLSVDPGYFNRFYQTVSLSEGDVVAVLRSTGDLLARAPGAQDYLGTVIKDAPYLDTNAPTQGSFRRAAQVDGIVRTYGYTRLAEYGLVVTTGLSDATTFSGYQVQRNWSIAAASCLTLALLLSIIFTIRPLEERERRALERARTSEESFQSLVNGVTDYAIFMLDQKGLVTQWNIGAQRIKGYTADEIIGRHFSCFYSQQDVANGQPERGLRLAAEQGRFELTGYRVGKSGLQFWANVVITPLRDGDGKLIGFAEVTRDISEQKHAEEEIARAEAQLRDAQKLEAIGHLTGGLAHDFNNLLGIVVGNLDLLGEQLPDDERTRRQHQTALDAALRGAEVTRSLLAVARRQTMEVQTYDLNALVGEMLPLLRSSAGSEISLSSELASGRLPASLDASGLSQVLLNLVINARDAMRNVSGVKNVILRTYSRALTMQDDALLTPGNYAVLEVSDTGSGMSEVIRAQSFEPFFTTKERGRGTGLGLAMVYGYATQLGGTASIESTEGAGTTVRVWLPLQRLTALADENNGAIAHSSGSDPAPAQARCRVLVVDDEESLCELACDWIESLGYAVTAANSPAQALELIDKKHFDVLFTDVVMPGSMDGVALARESLKRQPQLRVLLTSGYAQGQLESVELPGELLNKPYRKNQVHQALEALQAKRESKPAPART
jgi:PAS domain S-box-containing protein